MPNTRTSLTYQGYIFFSPHFLVIVLSTFAVIDILRMTILHPDGASLLLKHVENQNGIRERNLSFLFTFYTDN